ncbi:MAG TPA: magnesium transporter [Candidatus Paceibacterota bacterium]
MTYPEGSAGAIAIAEVPMCRPDDSVGLVFSFMKELAQTYKTINYIYVLDNRRLVGVLSIHELFSTEHARLIQDIMTTNVAYVHVHTDQEHVAQLALAQGIKAVPVINDDEQFVGIISSDALLRILNAEHIDDMHKSVGIAAEEVSLLDNQSWSAQVSARTPWLMLGLLGGVGAAVVIEAFESTIAHELAIAAFIPAVVYMSDAVGNQTEILFIRRLSRKEPVRFLSYLTKELTIGLSIAAILGSLTFGLSFFWLQDMMFSVVLAFAIVATVCFSIVVTVLLPWLFKQLGFDPAVASGPLATVICDLSSVVIYLLIASALL